MGDKPYQDKELLIYMRWGLNMNAEEIGDFFGITRRHVNRLLRKYDIPTTRTSVITDEFLRILWEEKHMSTEEIADFLNAPVNSVEDLFARSDYQRGQGTSVEYTEEEMIEWLEVYILEFGVEPRSQDLRDWPGPTASSYEYRFGSLQEALDKVDV